MTYSAALYTAPDLSLKTAQDMKYQAVLSALELQPGDDLLEIGCGWGGLAEAAAARGAGRYLGLTLSQEQLIHARQSGAQVEFRLQDYREVRGQYDKIASIEMIEAVGEQYWPVYFSTLAQRLKPGGAAVLQGIVIADELFEEYRRRPDFIQHYIFPGGMLPTVTRMRDQSRRVGLDFETVKMFGKDYARTLDEWHARFEAAWPEIERMGFDARFERMWRYYLQYCAAGFESGAIDVGLFRLTKAQGD